jgi:hypothetical protein
MADQDGARHERFARRQLEDLVVEAGWARIRAGTLADLLDQWFEAASPGWAASTVSHSDPSSTAISSRTSGIPFWIKNARIPLAPGPVLGLVEDLHSASA